ncbi:hypothetical protein OF83DRAFT_402509 [Amylostereum chailletii]|nr:hypothetical protein OF83DRAFT_402509 [Amylostereum chailletii]
MTTMFEEFVVRKPPLAQLPLELQPTKRTDNKPLLHFGFIFTETQFTDCSEKNNLVEDKWTGRRRKTVALFSVVEFLCKKSRALLQYQMPLCMDTHHMISLYSNFNIKRRQLREEDEKEVIEIIKKELCIEPSVEPMWWWDIKHGPGYVTISISET